MRREWEAYEDSLAIVRQFNARLSAKKAAWFWPTIGAALASKHHWLVIACVACDTVIDLDLSVKRVQSLGVVPPLTVGPGPSGVMPTSAAR